MVCYSTITVKYCRQNKMWIHKMKVNTMVCYSASAVKYCRQQNVDSQNEGECHGLLQCQCCKIL